ncbi:MAG: hypothetical protein HWD92_06220 [Flavobacteriia bacterium]|nr:hypothetical protein [Flavobacteriia bacterium]
MKNKGDILEYKIENSVNGGVRILFWMMFVLSIGLFLSAVYDLAIGDGRIRPLIIAACLLIISTFSLFAINVSQINLKNRKKRTANYLFGIYAGKWESLGNFCDVTVLKKNMSSKIQSAGNVSSHTKKDVVYEVHILNETHRKKWLVAKTQNPEMAKIIRDDVARELNFTATQYNPLPISPRGRRR